MDRFLSGVSAPRPAQPKKSPAVVAAPFVLPDKCDGCDLPAELELMLRDQQPLSYKRACWPLPGRLGFGSSPMDRLDPAQWLLQNGVRVVIDVSDSGLDDIGNYAKAVSAANALLLCMPLSPKYKLQATTTSAYVAACRVLHRALHETVNAEFPFAIYVCDKRGGGVAALIVEMLIALEVPCKLVDACVYTTRCWNTNLADQVQPRQMFPEGDILKAAMGLIFARLRDQPITGQSGATSRRIEHTEVFEAHRVAAMCRAATWLLDLDASLFKVAPSYERGQPLTVVVWARANAPPPPRPEKREDHRPWRRPNHDDDDDDDASDSEDTSVRRKRRWRRRNDDWE